MKELEAEREMSRAEVADYFRTFADRIESRGQMPNAETERGTSDVNAESDRRTSDRQTDRDDDDVERGGRTGKVTFMVGNESHTINPPDIVRFGIEVNSDRSLLGGSNDRGVTFELGWNEDDVPSDDEFSVE